MAEFPPQYSCTYTFLGMSVHAERAGGENHQHKEMFCNLPRSQLVQGSLKVLMFSTLFLKVSYLLVTNQHLAKGNCQPLIPETPQNHFSVSKAFGHGFADRAQKRA